MLSLYLHDLQKEMKSDMISKLEVQKQRYKEFSVNTRTVVRIGSSVDTMVKFAKDENVDLIIMGSRSSNGISKLLKGLGVSRSVYEKVKCTSTHWQLFGSDCIWVYKNASINYHAEHNIDGRKWIIRNHITLLMESFTSGIVEICLIPIILNFCYR